MTTVSDIIDAALKRPDITAISETSDALDAAYALSTLNRMMAAWRAMGVDVNHSTLALTDTFPLEDMLEDGVIALLAKRMASDHGANISQILFEDARDGWRALQADYCLVEPMRVDASLASMSSQRRWVG